MVKLGAFSLLFHLTNSVEIERNLIFVCLLPKSQNVSDFPDLVSNTQFKVGFSEER